MVEVGLKDGIPSSQPSFGLLLDAINEVLTFTVFCTKGMYTENKILM